MKEADREREIQRDKDKKRESKKERKREREREIEEIKCVSRNIKQREKERERVGSSKINFGKNVHCKDCHKIEITFSQKTSRDEISFRDFFISDGICRIRETILLPT